MRVLPLLLSILQVENEPSLEMTTAMFANISKGLSNNYVPFSDHGDTSRSFYAPPEDLVNTFSLESGIGATCVLKSPQWNATPEYEDSCYRAMSRFGLSAPTRNSGTTRHRDSHGLSNIDSRSSEFRDVTVTKANSKTGIEERGKFFVGGRWIITMDGMKPEFG